MPPKSKAKANSKSKPTPDPQTKKVSSSGTNSNHPPPSSSSSSPSKISWPPLRPLLPTYSLDFSTEIPDQIYLVRKFFLPALCKSYIHFLSSLPLITTPSTAKRGDAVRVNDRFQIEDGNFASMLWESSGLKDVVARYLEDNGTAEDEEDGKENNNNNNNNSNNGRSNAKSKTKTKTKTKENDGDNDYDDNQYEIRKIKARKSSAKKLFGGEPLGLNPNIRIYRYSKGQFFAKHCMYHTITYHKKNITLY